MTVKLVAATGLSLVMIGSTLLFFYGFPTTTIGNTRIIGELAVLTDGEPKPEDDPAVWQPAASAFLQRAKLLNQTGFGLITIGTLLQLLAVLSV